MKEALFYRKESDNKVRCSLCRHNCLIGDGKPGICAVRENRGGVLYSLVYGKVIAEHADPIEKKPLFHVLPGSRTFSIATTGCNFHCRHCQNYAISQVDKSGAIPGRYRSPADIVQSAVDSDCSSIAYTYTEPTIFYEFALDTARLAGEKGLQNIFVSNGYIGKEPLAQIAPLLTAANIDLKGFSEKFYREIVGAKLSEVLDCISDYQRLGIWLEITTLIIPGLNDSDAELESIAAFIVQHLGKETPWHVSQFYPTYLLTDRPPTAVATVLRAAEIGRAAGLAYVYVGNIPTRNGEDTGCPGCGATVIARSGYRVTTDRLLSGCCPDCGTKLAGVWRGGSSV
jgi:pyruvate formate lyase activating enzyme